MLLAIDIGNTNVHIGIFEEDILQSSYSLIHKSADIFQTDFIRFLKSTIPPNPDAVVLASVNPKVETFIIQGVKEHCHIMPRRIGKDIPIPIPVLTQYPEKVGIDRLVNAVAAFERIKDWAIIIDAGTAITIDVINDTGAFLGGIIAPGIEISAKALHHYTALLPDISVHKPVQTLGKNTEDAMCSGIYWGTIGMVSTLITMLCNELGCRPNVIVTGGDAEMLVQEIPFIHGAIPHLILEGIRTTYKIHHLSNR